MHRSRQESDQMNKRKGHGLHDGDSKHQTEGSQWEEAANGQERQLGRWLLVKKVLCLLGR